MNRRMTRQLSMFTILLLLAPAAIVSTSLSETLSLMPSTMNQHIESAYADQQSLSRIAFVASNPQTYTDDFAYIATVPTGVFYHNETQYISPVIFSAGSQSEMYLVEDWATYLSDDGGISQGIVVGDMSESLLIDLQDTAGAQLYPRITGATSAEIAAKLAVMEWASSPIAVVSLAMDDFSNPTPIIGGTTHTLSGRASSTSSFSGSVSYGAPTSNQFTPPSWAVWMHGQFNWTGAEILTHELIDPNGEVVDYSVYSQMYFSRNPAYVSSPVPMQFWLPVNVYGDWTMNVTTDQTHSTSLVCNVTYHPGYRHTVSVPANAKSLDVSLIWDNLGTDLNLALIDPNGRMAMWAPAGSILSSPGRESISLPYPMAGQWTIIAGWMDATEEGNNIQLDWTIELLPSEIESYFESAGNGAVLASLLNAPLLYADATGVPAITQWALERLGVTSIALVDPSGLQESSLVTELSGIASVLNLDSYNDVSGNITSLSKSPDIVVSVPTGTGDEFLASSVYAAAVHGSPIFSLAGQDNEIATRAQETWAPYLIGPEINNIYVINKYENRAENGWYDERIPNKFSMIESVDTFEGFLSVRGAYNATANQPVVVVSPVSLVPTSFDRSLVSHFRPGRIPAETADMASVMINRGLLHQYLYLVSESADTALISMYAYTDGATFIDNNYDYHDIFQIEDSTDALTLAGLQMEYHVGAAEVFDALDSQVAFWTLSTHGTLTLLPRDPPDRPNGPGHISLRSADAQWGFEVSESTRESPADSDELVNPVAFQSELQYHVTRSTSDLDSSIGNIGSPIIILTACLLGGTEMPTMLMEHGAVAVTASPRTVYFRAAGLLSVLLAEGLSTGGTIGAALAEAHSLVSADYSDPLVGREPRDYANQQVLFGDPSVRLYDPNVPRIISVDPMSRSFDGHTPGLGIPSVAALGSTDYLPISLDNVGVRHDFYTASNFSEFMLLLSLRLMTIVEPGVIDSFSANLTQNSEVIESYIRSGGILAILGTSGDLSWLPWTIGYSDAGSGATVSFEEPTHPLLNLPNELNSTLDYQGYFTTIWSNLTVLATDGAHPVFVAGSVGNGKVALTTIDPTGLARDALIENFVHWSEVSSIRLRQASLSQVIIWAGDQVTISLQLTDEVGNPLESTAVEVWLNTSAFTVEELGDGMYSIPIAGDWTGSNIGTFDLHVDARLSGYDPLRASIESFILIRPFPTLIIALFGGVLVVGVVGYVYYKRRRGESFRGDSKQTKRQKERQREQDGKVDAKEYFGV